MLRNSTCNVICSSFIPAPMNDGLYSDAVFINDKITDSYNFNWLIDGLPAARARIDTQTDEPFYSVGFELGSVTEEGVAELNNHYDLIIEYHVLAVDCETC